MPIEERELVTGFAEAVRVGDATVFVGAGLSVAAGLPTWGGLIAEARHQANVPEEIEDAPLAAEYIANVNGPGWLDGEIRQEIDLDVDPTPVHRSLAALRMRDYWTTNYDNLIEDAMGLEGAQFQRIVGEDDYSKGPVSATREKRVTKMHGSLDRGPAGRRLWEVPPVITRSHFERYEQTHPITWARLRATWLTSSLLFLGLSFDDPNLNLLLRLSRSLPEGVDAPKHYVVFTRKDKEPDRRLQELRIQDLERSGVAVHVLEQRDDLAPLLRRLEVRCRPPALFIGGSFKLREPERDEHAIDVATNLALGLADLSNDEPDFGVVSFGSPSGQVVSKQFRDALPPDSYQPDRIKFFYRKAKGPNEKIEVEHRVGMAIFTQLEEKPMRDRVLPQVRCVVTFGGGTRTHAEIAAARALAIPVVPIATTGGAALSVWETSTPDQMGLDAPHVAELWAKLNSPMPAIAASAATQLVKGSMLG